MRGMVIYLLVHHANRINIHRCAGGVELDPDIPGVALDQRRDEPSDARDGICFVAVYVGRQHRQIHSPPEIGGPRPAVKATGFADAIWMAGIGQPQHWQTRLCRDGELSESAGPLFPEIQDDHRFHPASVIGQAAVAALLTQQRLGPLNHALRASDAHGFDPLGGRRKHMLPGLLQPWLVPGLVSSLRNRQAGQIRSHRSWHA